MPTNALSQYFPFLKDQHSNSHEALSCTFAIASVGVTMLTMLEKLLPAAASEVEHESRAVTQNFEVLASYVEGQKDVPKEVTDAINSIVMGMQFQDRNTQVIENVVGMLERYRSMLEEVCDKIKTAPAENNSSEETVVLAVESILSSIRLSDIRNRYLDALAKTTVHANIEQKPNASAGDIELF